MAMNKKKVISTIVLVIVVLFFISSLIMLAFANQLEGKFSFENIYSESAYEITFQSIELLKNGNTGEAIELFNPDIPNLEQGIQQVSTSLSEHNIHDLELINVQKSWISNSDGRTTTEIFEIESKSNVGYALITVTAVTKNNDT